MGFTTSCFIRKNTPELLTKLENLGYKSVSLIEGLTGLMPLAHIN